MWTRNWTRRGAHAVLALAAVGLLAAACDDGGGGGDDDAMSDMTADGMDTAQVDTTGDTSQQDTSTPGCQENSECTDDTRPICDQATGLCEECVVDADCDENPNGNACETNRCVVLECREDADCADNPNGNLCVMNQCQAEVVECAGDFDCTAEQPDCVIPDGEEMGTCMQYDACDSDDDGEIDDGPVAATDITVDAGASQTIENRQICNAPDFAESDWYAFDVEDGDHVTITLTMPNGDDLDMDVYDSQLRLLGRSWWSSPEVIEVTYLPAGTYYVAITLFTQSATSVPADYSLTIERTGGNSCTDATDCDDVYSNQIFRGDCTAAGACAFIEVDTPLGNGEACDSFDDCESEYCAYGEFSNIDTNGDGDANNRVSATYTADAATRAVCTSSCTDDATCGTDQVCTSGFDDFGNYCVANCTSTAECPVLTFSPPVLGGSWDRMTCDVATGDCIVLNPLITVSDQTVTDPTAITVDTVNSHGPGFVAVHEDDNGSPGAVIGTMAVQSGITNDLVVTLDRELTDGELIRPMLHNDLGTVGTFEFDPANGVETDPPAINRNGNTVVTSATITVSQPVMPSVTATAKTLDDLTSYVSVDEVVSDGAGWIVIHEDDGAGAPGTVIGFAAVADGTNTDVQVELDRPAVDAETLYAMLHADTGTMGTFEFDGTMGSEDQPVIDSATSMPVMASFDVTVPDATPDVRFTISNNGISAWVFDTVEPAWASGMVTTGMDNPALTLETGWRYAVVNNGAETTHPFELITVGALGDGTDDVVLLSEESGVDGTLEGDTTIAWDESQTDLVLFSAATTLTTASDGFRCGVHIGAMRGSITWVAP